MFMEIEGIKSELTKNKFVYHITGFGQNIFFDKVTREMTVVCCHTNEVIFKFEDISPETTFEEFLDASKKIHLKMIDDFYVGVVRIYPEVDN